MHFYFWIKSLSINIIKFDFLSQTIGFGQMSLRFTGTVYIYERHGQTELMQTVAYN